MIIRVVQNDQGASFVLEQLSRQFYALGLGAFKGKSTLSIKMKNVKHCYAVLARFRNLKIWIPKFKVIAPDLEVVSSNLTISFDIGFPCLLSGVAGISSVDLTVQDMTINESRPPQIEPECIKIIPLVENYTKCTMNIGVTFR